MCNFSIDFTQNPAEIVTKAKDAITGLGGNFTGDDSAGDFGISTPLGSVSGEYTISGQSITINISKKPVFVPCSEIEKQLRKQLS